MTHFFPAAPLRAALLCLATAGAHAAPVNTPGAADPLAAVPATRYQPAFDWRIEPAPPTRPDRRWQASNAIVAGTHAMSMTMPDMAGHATPGTPAPAPGAAAHDHHAGMAMPPAPEEEQR